jgi:hypothetical protein
LRFGRCMADEELAAWAAGDAAPIGEVGEDFDHGVVVAAELGGEVLS